MKRLFLTAVFCAASCSVLAAQEAYDEFEFFDGSAIFDEEEEQLYAPPEPKSEPDVPPESEPEPEPAVPAYGLFVAGGLQYFILADDTKALITSTTPGLRLSAGWELPRGTFPNGERGIVFLGAETGWTTVGIDDPLRPIVTMFFLSFKTGYAFPVASVFSLRLDALVGGLFSLGGAKSSVDPLFGGRFSAEWVFKRYPDRRPLLSFSVGGGADFIPQINGLIVLPVADMGLRVSL